VERFVEHRLGRQGHMERELLRPVCEVLDQSITARLAGILKRVLIDAQRGKRDVVVRTPEAKEAQPFARRRREADRLSGQVCEDVNLERTASGCGGMRKLDAEREPCRRVARLERFEAARKHAPVARERHHHARMRRDCDHHHLDVAPEAGDQLSRLASRLIESPLSPLDRLHAGRDVEDENRASTADRGRLLRPVRPGHRHSERAEQGDLQREEQVRAEAAAPRFVPHHFPQNEARHLDLPLPPLAQMKQNEQAHEDQRGEPDRRREAHHRKRSIPPAGNTCVRQCSTPESGETTACPIAERWQKERTASIRAAYASA
jgi:hypothetical protein